MPVRLEEGLHLLAEARTVLEVNGQGELLAEAYRLQGEFLLRQAAPDVAQAEACFAAGPASRAGNCGADLLLVHRGLPLDLQEAQVLLRAC